ncbi:MAG: hypothetical protein ACKVQV_14535 [Bacteroidia bacterium]
MTEEIKIIINKLEQYIQLVQETGEQDELMEKLNEFSDELEQMENNFDAIDSILELIERSPDIDYGGPGPLAHFMEAYYKKGYEELLLKSIERKPTEYTLYLLHRLINDGDNPNRTVYLDLMKKISLSEEFPQNIIANAKESLADFQ